MLIAMIKNYVKIAFRNIRRNFTYSFINIAGLAVGLASAIVIGLWVYQEWSYDRHFDHAERIYRVGVGFMNIGDMAPGPEQFTEIARGFPEVERATSLNPMKPVTISVGNNGFEENNAFFADSVFFKVFSYSFLEGSPETALLAPGSVVLSESVARKYFRGASAVGKVIELVRESRIIRVMLTTRVKPRGCLLWGARRERFRGRGEEANDMN